MQLQEIENQLSTKIDSKIASRIIKHYFEAKECYYRGDPEKSQLKVGKFIEEVCHALKFIVTGHSITGKIEVDNIVRELENAPTHFSDEIRIIIPRVCRAVYAFRNKRSVAHSNGIEPTFIDAEVSIANADWVLAELLRLFHNYSEDQIREIMQALIVKRVPILQKIEDHIVVLDKSISAKNAVLLILYETYPKWVEKDKIIEWLSEYESEANIKISLGNAKKERFVFAKDDKCIITNSGLAYVEQNFKDKLLVKKT